MDEASEKENLKNLYVPVKFMNLILENKIWTIHSMLPMSFFFYFCFLKYKLNWWLVKCLKDFVHKQINSAGNTTPLKQLVK